MVGQASVASAAVKVAVHPQWSHPSWYAVHGLTAALHDAGVTAISRSPTLGRFLSRVPPSLNRRWIGGAGHVIVPMMGPVWRYLDPYAISQRVAIYAWDIWPSNRRSWITHLRNYEVSTLFASSRAAAELVQDEVECAVRYVPEGCTPEAFTPSKLLGQRRLQVLELGRRSDQWHRAVRSALAQEGHVHRYQQAGRLVFQSRQEFVDGLADTAVSVCFPQSVTHPEVAGSIAALTQRYLESMAAGCLVVGESPNDLVELFGYDPVIPVDWSDPSGQLLTLLKHLDAHQGLVQRNLDRLAEVGAWRHRIREILSGLA